MPAIQKSRKIERQHEIPITDPHHRRPQALGGQSNPENISIVPIKKHRAWHILFRNHPPEVIAEIINKTWLDPEFELVVIPRKKKGRRQY